MIVRPLTLKQANAFIEEHHRHHKKVVGHRFSLGLFSDNLLIGVCIVGRPVARGCDPYFVAEVTRLATDGAKNGCSMLYAAAARACDAMGFDKIQTYILESEPGISLRAAGWSRVAVTAGGSWNHGGEKSHKNRREDQPMEPKVRWERVLTNGKREALSVS